MKALSVKAGLAESLKWACLVLCAVPVVLLLVLWFVVDWVWHLGEGKRR